MKVSFADEKVVTKKDAGHGTLRVLLGVTRWVSFGSLIVHVPEIQTTQKEQL